MRVTSAWQKKTLTYGYSTCLAQKVFLFSGWSEKMLEYIAMAEKEPFNILQEIKEKY